MVVEKRVNGNEVYLGLKRTASEKIPGVIFLTFFFGVFILSFASFNPMISLSFLGVYLLILTYHLRYNYDGKLYINKDIGAIRMKKNTIVVNPGDKVVVVNEQRLFLYIAGRTFHGIPMEGAMGMFQDLEGQGEVVRRRGKWCMMIDVTDRPDIIAEFKRPTTKIFGFPVNGPYGGHAYIADSHISYYVNITIERENGMKEVLIGEDASKMNLLDTSLIFKDKLDDMLQIAEELAENLGLTLVDHSGMEPRIREPGTTDMFLGDYLREKGYPEPATGVVSAEVEGDTRTVSMPHEFDSMQVIETLIFLFFGWLTFGAFRLSFIPLFEMFSSGVTSQRITSFIFMFIIGAILLIITRAMLIASLKENKVEITPENTFVKRKIIFYARTLHTIPTKEIEAVSIWRKPYGRSIVNIIQIKTDKVFVNLPAGYSHLDIAVHWRDRLKYELTQI